MNKSLVFQHGWSQLKFLPYEWINCFNFHDQNTQISTLRFLRQGTLISGLMENTKISTLTHQEGSRFLLGILGVLLHVGAPTWNQCFYRSWTSCSDNAKHFVHFQEMHIQMPTAVTWNLAAQKQSLSAKSTFGVVNHLGWKLADSAVEFTFCLPMLHPRVKSSWRAKSLRISYRSIIVLQQLYCLFYRTYQKSLWKWTEVSARKVFLDGKEFPKLLEFQI